MEELFLLLSRSLARKGERVDQEASELKEEFQRLLTMLSSCEEDWSVERLCRESSLSRVSFFLTNVSLRTAQRRSFFRHGWRRPNPSQQ